MDHQDRAKVVALNMWMAAIIFFIIGIIDGNGWYFTPGCVMTVGGWALRRVNYEADQGGGTRHRL